MPLLHFISCAWDQIFFYLTTSIYCAVIIFLGPIYALALLWFVKVCLTDSRETSLLNAFHPIANVNLSNNDSAKKHARVLCLSSVILSPEKTDKNEGDFMKPHISRVARQILHRTSRHSNKDKDQCGEISFYFLSLPECPLAAANMTTDISGVNTQEEQLIKQTSQNHVHKEYHLLVHQR